MKLEHGWRMPAEWALHQCCWIAWPCREATFHGRFEEAKRDVAAVARGIASAENVKLLVREADFEEATQLCGPAVQLVKFELSDSWTRDSGPSFVLNELNELAGVDWYFNAYGSLALQEDGSPISDPEFANDQTLAKRILESVEIPRLVAPLVLEGGSIHVDGSGTLLTTEQCLISRNSGKTRLEIEGFLSEFLGTSKTIWLGEGLQDDETNGHVDNLACFVNEGVVLALNCEDSQDPNYEPLKDNLRRLRLATDAHGRSLEVSTINQPPAAFRKNGDRLSQSYLNFYLANGAVICPAFGYPTEDESALERLRSLFPDRRVIPVSISNLIHGGGGIHCITQQQPVGRNSVSPKTS